MAEYRRWSQAEFDLLKHKSDEEIARKTGRTIRAIRKMRNLIDRGYKPIKPADENVILNPNREMTQEEKELRIKELALRYHVRLLER